MTNYLTTVDTLIMSIKDKDRKLTPSQEHDVNHYLTPKLTYTIKSRYEAHLYFENTKVARIEYKGNYHLTGVVYLKYDNMLFYTTTGAKLIQETDQELRRFESSLFLKISPFAQVDIAYDTTTDILTQLKEYIVSDLLTHSHNIKEGQPSATENRYSLNKGVCWWKEPVNYECYKLGNRTNYFRLYNKTAELETKEKPYQQQYHQENQLTGTVYRAELSLSEHHMTDITQLFNHDHLLSILKRYDKYLTILDIYKKVKDHNKHLKPSKLKLIEFNSTSTYQPTKLEKTTKRITNSQKSYLKSSVYHYLSNPKQFITDTILDYLNINNDLGEYYYHKVESWIKEYKSENPAQQPKQSDIDTLKSLYIPELYMMAHS